MNKERIRRLINFIQKSDSFSMHATYWNDPMFDRHYKSGIQNSGMGCPACIAGHYEEMEKGNGIARPMSQSEFCYEIGISEDEGERIHSPLLGSDGVSYKAYPKEKGYITKNMAIDVLRNFLETGEVDWVKEHKNEQRENLETC